MPKECSTQIGGSDAGYKLWYLQKTSQNQKTCLKGFAIWTFLEPSLATTQYKSRESDRALRDQGYISSREPGRLKMSRDRTGARALVGQAELVYAKGPGSHWADSNNVLN